MGVIPLQRKVSLKQKELQTILSDNSTILALNNELLEYKKELGDFNIFGLINKQLLVWTRTAEMSFVKMKSLIGGKEQAYWY